MSEVRCYKCSKVLDFKPGHKAHRSDVCTNCNSDVKCCKNCSHYNINAYNQCKENQADRVVDKERANFCDYFVLRASNAIDNQNDSKQDAKSKLDALFKA